MPFTAESTADGPANEAFEPLESVPWRMGPTTAGQLLERVRADLGKEAVIETSQDLLESLHCPQCNETQPLYTSLGKVTEGQGRCPD